jgi:hypothetical protein
MPSSGSTATHLVEADLGTWPKILIYLDWKITRGNKKRRWIAFAMETSWNNEITCGGISWICVELALVQFASVAFSLVDTLFNGVIDVVLEYRGMLAGSSSTPLNSPVFGS